MGGRCGAGCGRAAATADEPIAGLALVAALAVAVAVAGLQGTRSPRRETSGSATTAPAPVSADPRAAFSQIFAQPPTTDPNVLELTTSFAAHLPAGIEVDARAPREMPSDMGSPLYTVIRRLAERLLPGPLHGCGVHPPAGRRRPGHPAGLAGQCSGRLARDGGTRARRGRPDDRADGRSEDGHPEGRWQRGLRSPRRSTGACPDHAPRRYDGALRLRSHAAAGRDPADDEGVRRSGDRSRAFVRDNPALVAAVGPAVVASGTVELPKPVQEKVADLDRRLGECLGRSRAARRSPADRSGWDAGEGVPGRDGRHRRLRGERRELNATGIVRFLTADALEQCGRLGRPAEGSPPPPDGTTAVIPAAERSCRQAVIGHLPPLRRRMGVYAHS